MKRFNVFKFILISFLFISLNNVIVSAEPFTDIDNHWAKEVIIKMNTEGFVKGKTANEFRPNDILKKAEFITMINRMFSFDKTLETGLAKGTWYEYEIEKAYYYNYYSFEDIDFNKPITRLECIKILNNIIKKDYKDINDITLPFKDIDKLSPEDKKIISSFYNEGFINGDNNGKLNPYGYLTRAEMVKIFDNILGYIVVNTNDINDIPKKGRVTIIGDDISIKVKEIDSLFVSQGANGFTIYNSKVNTACFYGDSATYLRDTSITELYYKPAIRAYGELYLEGSTYAGLLITNDPDNIVYYSDNIPASEYYFIEKESLIDITPKSKTSYKKNGDAWVQSDNGTHIGIYSVEDLISIEKWGLDKNYVLMKDLDISNIASYRNPYTLSFGDYNGDGKIEKLIDEITGDIDGLYTGFVPIGSKGKEFEDKMFSGEFDGNGHSIKNIYINDYKSVGEVNTGLFYGINVMGDVKNLNLVDYNINVFLSKPYTKESGYYLYKGADIIVGSIASYNLGNILDCSVSGDINVSIDNKEVIETAIHIGGIIGVNDNMIENCSADVDIECTPETRIVEKDKIINNLMTELGGIVGTNYGNILTSDSKGEIKADDLILRVGGIAGFNNNEIKKCKSNCDIYATDKTYVNVSGIVGESNTEKNYSDSSFTGNIIKYKK